MESDQAKICDEVSAGNSPAYWSEFQHKGIGKNLSDELCAIAFPYLLGVEKQQRYKKEHIVQPVKN